MCINPPIRGSIVMKKEVSLKEFAYQSPYKGFNRRKEERHDYIQQSQSPYKGFNSL